MIAAESFFLKPILLQNKLLPECILSQNPKDFVGFETFFLEFFSSFLECRENDRGGIVFFENRLLRNKLLPECLLSQNSEDFVG
jgi:hypothetical protein